ncbi:hypothetical protein [uncultured Nostoc sp.]|uniref:hypothetical protein n=1 Tax=uncultured Nostoc sp. TaxID=340711 RepID=UPI0035CC6F82
MHTLKKQFIVLPNGEDIVDVYIGNLGKTSDINLFRETQGKFDCEQKIIGDKLHRRVNNYHALQETEEERNFGITTKKRKPAVIV